MIVNRKNIIKILVVFFICFFLISNISLASDSIYVWSSESKTVNEVQNSNTSETVSTSTDLKLESASAVLIEQSTGQVLYEHNMHEKLRPASVTKVMTLLLIMEAIDSGRLSYTDKIPCSENAAGMGGSQIWLDVRE